MFLRLSRNAHRPKQYPSIVDCVLSTPQQQLSACVLYALLWICYTLSVEIDLVNAIYDASAHIAFPISCILILYLHHRIIAYEKKDEGMECG